MSHTAIAVISYGEKEDRKFLVLQDEDKKNYFYSVQFNALFASFDMDRFKTNVSSFLGMETDNLNFRYIVETDWIDRDKPNTTICDVNIQEDTISNIETHLEEKKSLSYKWVSYNDIETKKDLWIKKQKFILDDVFLNYYSPFFPEFDNAFLTKIEILKEAIHNNKLVIFAGSGVSANSGVPTWYPLVTALKNGITLTEDDVSEYGTELVILAQMFYNTHKKMNIIKRFKIYSNMKKFRKMKYMSELLILILYILLQQTMTTSLKKQSKKKKSYTIKYQKTNIYQHPKLAIY